MIYQQHLIETERLRLRITDLTDAAFTIELLNSPAWLEQIGDRNVRTIEEAETYISTKISPQYESHGYSNYTVIRKEDNAKLGSCGLYDREGLEGVDIGFAFLPQYAKMGYAYEAAMAVLQMGFETFKIEKVSAITTKTNLDSQRLISKLGLKYREIIRIPNDEEELMLYTLTEEEYNKYWP